MFESALDCRQTISNVFSNEMGEPLDKKLLLENTDSKLKECSV